MATMEFVFNSLPKFDKRAHTLSEWVNKLEQRFVLAEVEDDSKKIQLCRLFIGQAGEDVLGGLPEGATWEQAKAALVTRLGEGTQAEEAYHALRNLSRDNRDLTELGCEVEKLSKRAYPGQPEIIERHAIEAFLQVLDKPLAVEVQKLGHRRFSDVVSAARRIEKLQIQNPTPGLEGFVSVLQDEIRALRKEMEKGKTSAAVNLTQAPSPSPVPPPTTVPQTQDSAYVRHYLVPFDGAYQQPRRPGPFQRSTGYRPLRCFFCDEEGHIVAECRHKRRWKQRQQQQQAAPSQQPRALPPTDYLAPPADDRNPRPTITLN